MDALRHDQGSVFLVIGRSGTGLTVEIAGEECVFWIISRYCLCVCINP